MIYNMNKKKIILIAVAVVAVAGISIRLFGGPRPNIK